MRCTSFCANCGAPAERPKKRGGRIAILILALLLTVSVGLHVWQLLQLKNTEADYRAKLEAAQQTADARLDSVISYRREVASQEHTIAKQKEEIFRLQSKGTWYDDIVTGMRYGSSGYAAPNFFAGDSVIVVNKMDKSKQFTLTANWMREGKVEVSCSSDAASVSFDQTEWFLSTTVTVHPKTAGVTVATFRNTVDSKTFKVLIIVTD